jgi:hypothetical protein
VQQDRESEKQLIFGALQSTLSSGDQSRSC